MDQHADLVSLVGCPEKSLFNSERLDSAEADVDVINDSGVRRVQIRWDSESWIAAFDRQRSLQEYGFIRLVDSIKLVKSIRKYSSYRRGFTFTSQDRIDGPAKVIHSRASIGNEIQGQHQKACFTPCHIEMITEIKNYLRFYFTRWNVMKCGCGSYRPQCPYHADYTRFCVYVYFEFDPSDLLHMNHAREI